MTTPMSVSRRNAYIIWGALLLGVLSFAAVASIVAPGVRAGSHAPDVLAEIAVALSVVCVVLSRVVPGRLRQPSGVDPEAFALSRNIVAAALCEGPSLFAIVAWMLTGRAWAAVGFAFAVAGLVACFPGDARWRSLVPAVGSARDAARSRLVR